ncbi:hypothetical protein RHSP_82977 [Rhizobium freirei PRF 81]|uniref:Uncharacterized protein n=1 Tax=Rhizobium freirei PRF 81 TaxID=363754 RepID=N6V4U2_9HYPH|nr:hypothetical protein RHSP_82977 [Rhizobium freirei PRF 81]
MGTRPRPTGGWHPVWRRLRRFDTGRRLRLPCRCRLGCKSRSGHAADRCYQQSCDDVSLPHVQCLHYNRLALKLRRPCERYRSRYFPIFRGKGMLRTKFAGSRRAIFHYNFPARGCVSKTQVDPRKWSRLTPKSAEDDRLCGHGWSLRFAFAILDPPLQ